MAIQTDWEYPLNKSCMNTAAESPGSLTNSLQGIDIASSPLLHTQLNKQMVFNDGGLLGSNMTPEPCGSYTA